MTRYLSIVLCLVFGAAAAAADLDSVRTFDIKPQRLETALIEFSKQADLQVIGATDTLADTKTKGVSGKLSSREALNALLKNTRLAFNAVGTHSVQIVQPKPQPSAQSTSSDAPALRMAKIDAPDAQAEGERAAEDAQDMKGVPEILVKGNRSINVDIARTEDDPQPYVVFDRKEIERSQATTLEDFLRTRLPQNTSNASPSQGIGTAIPYSVIDLRGLGAAQTLVLVDGRRLAGVGNAGNFAQQPDINGIALSAIERIEILPSTAGGIYGGGATGGVINIIMRRDFHGMEVKADYGNTFDSDTSSVRLEANGGFSLEGGRTQIMVSASRSEANRLLVGDRDFSARGRALQLRNYPELLTRDGVPLGLTANIQSADGSPLTLDAQFGGAALGSDITHLPLGYSGPASDGGARLIANAGSFNYELSHDLNGTQQGLLGSPGIESASLNVRREFTRRFQAFVDVSSRVSRRSSFGLAAVPNQVTLDADAPTNYFAQDVVVRFPSPNMLFPIRGKTDTVRATGGLIFTLPKSWTTELDYNWSRSRYASVATGSALRSTVNAALQSGLPVDGRPALDPLRDTNTFPMDFSPFLLPSPNRFNGPNDTIMKDGTLRVSGPVMKLPGGQLTLSALAERRDEASRDAYLENLNPATARPRYTFYPARSQRIDSLYLEARAPLLSQLEVQASVRRDDYRLTSDGSSGYPIPAPEGPFPTLTYSTSKQGGTDYTLGLRYAPVEDVAFRASIGTGFLPPNVTEISSTEDEYDFEFGPDPKRDNTDVYTGTPVTVINGGSTRLRPEESESLSVGVILTPRVLKGLRVSVDYTRIDKTDEIGYPDMSFILANPDLFPGRVERAAPLPTDDPRWLGPVTRLDLTLLNLSKSTVESYDVQADYVISTGRRGDFRLFALATWEPRLRRQLLPDQPWQEYVSLLDGPLEWRGNAGFTWERGPLSVGWSTQYYDSYKVYDAYSLTDPDYKAELVLSQGTDTIPSQVYHDVFARFRFGAQGWKWLAGAEVSAGIQNVFNTSPPIFAITDAYMTSYSTHADPRLRRYTVSVRRSF